MEVVVYKGKAMWGHSKKAAICKLRREVSSETNPTGTLILDFQPPELWENTFLLLKPHSPWYSVTAPWLD